MTMTSASTSTSTSLHLAPLLEREALDEKLSRLERLERFAQRLLNPDDLGWSCSGEVRQAAGQALDGAVWRAPKSRSACLADTEERASAESAA